MSNNRPTPEDIEIAELVSLGKTHLDHLEWVQDNAKKAFIALNRGEVPDKETRQLAGRIRITVSNLLEYIEQETEQVSENVPEDFTADTDLKAASEADRIVTLLMATLSGRGYQLIYDGHDWRIVGNPQPFNLVGVYLWLGGKDK